MNCVFNTSALNVILERERSELPRGSRNITSLSLNRMYHPGCSANSLRSKPSMTIIADSSVDSVKTRREKILAYIEVREFSLFRSFGARCAARCDFYILIEYPLSTSTNCDTTSKSAALQE